MSEPVAQLIAAAQEHRDSQRFDEAETAYGEALKADSRNVDALIGLGLLRLRRDACQTAGQFLLQAADIDPKAWKAHHGLGLVYASVGNHDTAIQSYRKSLRLCPKEQQVRHDLSHSLIAVGRFSEAAECLAQVAESDPTNARAHNDLGVALLQQGLIDQAIEVWREALALKPDYLLCRTNLLFCLNFTSTNSAEAVFEEHLEWGRSCTAGPAVSVGGGIPDTVEGRRVRVGFVSPDFYTHSVAFFLEPLLANLDRTAVETFCYAEVDKPDKLTRRIMAIADNWSYTVGVSDQAVAERIAADKIDVLIDLAGHTKKNRLSVFALRPAPVQVTWLGYPNTTGLEAIDYRITDEICDPPPQADKFMIESPLRLANGFLCYRPYEAAPPVVDPPCIERGFITFGSFNNLRKVSADTIALWSSLLRFLPSARLTLKNVGPTDRALCEHVINGFESNGVDGQRITLVRRTQTIAAHLEHYGGVDIALDTFPYNGTTTTCEALWMGVPVVTLLGDRHAGRVGASLLEHSGLSEFVARDPDDFIDLAVSLARNVDRLVSLRRDLREKMRAAPLMNEKDFAREMERAIYRMIAMKREALMPCPA